MKLRSFAFAFVLSAVALSGCKKEEKKAEVEAPPGDDAYSLLGFDPAAAHDPAEPDWFDAKWAARESEDVLKRAKAKELENRNAVVPGGSCTAFLEGKTVRRMLLGTGRPGEPTQEITFSNKGSIILWFQSDRQTPATYQWAYFHRNGGRVERFNTKAGSSAMSTEEAPPALSGTIAKQTNGCLDALSADNPRVLSGATFAPASPKSPPQSVQPTVARTKIRSGEAFEITFGRAMSAPAGQQYWITATRPGDVDSSWGSWHYLPANATSDRLEVKGKGEFEIRLHDLYPQNTNRVIWRQRVVVD
jgi:hypothetical protein